jgi:hypothetical protein
MARKTGSLHEDARTHISPSNSSPPPPPRKSCNSQNNLEKHGKVTQATDDNTVLSLCMLDN